MKAKLQFSIVIATAAAAMLLGGCSAGDAPTGMTGDDAKSAIDKMSPQDQIRAIQSSPMPPDEKAKRIAEIEAKSGVKAEETGAPRGTGTYN